MRFPRFSCLCALLLCAFCSPAFGQYLYLDTNGDGVWTSDDRLNPDTTTVRVWLDTNHDRDGSQQLCNSHNGISYFHLSIMSSTSAGSTTVASDDPNRFLAVQPGMSITGLGIPAGTTVVSVNSGSSLTISNAATLTRTGNYTYAWSISCTTQGFTVGSTVTGGGSFSCKTTSGSTTVTSSAAFANVVVGETITGADIPPGATVTAKASSSSITISLAATGSSTAARTFGSTANLISASGLFANVVVGMSVAGTAMAAGTTVTDKFSSNLLTISPNATTANSSATRTFLGNALTSAGLFGSVTVGMTISGTGIPVGATVAAKTDNSNITMSANTTTVASTSVRVFAAMVIKSDVNSNASVTAGLFEPVAAGMDISGTGIDPLTLVVSIQNASHLTIDRAATADGTESLSYGNALNEFSYDLNFHADGGNVSYGDPSTPGVYWTPASGYNSSGPDGANETDLSVHCNRAAGANVIGQQLLGWFLVTVVDGSPGISLVPNSPVDLTGVGTVFGTNCDASIFTNSYALGTDWFDQDGTGAPPGSGNQAPSLEVPSHTSVTEGQVLALPATARDGDPQDILTVTVKGLPAGAVQLSNATGLSPLKALVGGVLSFYDSGNFAITWSVSDGVNPPVTAGTMLSVMDSVPATLADAPIARYVSLDSLDGAWSLPSEGGWSPTGLAFALNGSDGLYVYDLVHSGQGPRRVLDSSSPYVRWSPDGTWLLARVQLRDELRAGSASLVAVPVAGGVTQSLVEGADVGKFVWASNGEIYYWERRSGRRRRIDPPAAWRLVNPASYPPRAELVLISDPEQGGHRLARFIPAPQEQESSLPGFGAPDVNIVAVMAALPSGGQFLAHVFPRSASPYTAVIDDQGHTITRFDRDPSGRRFVGTTVSADGRFVVGYHETDDGYKVTDSQLILADVLGRWRVAITAAPRGVVPRMSPSGTHLVFDDPVAGRIHVGHVEIAGR